MVRKYSTAAARNQFADLVRASASGDRVKVTRYNRTVAVLIPKSDLEKLEDCERQHDGRQPRRKKAKAGAHKTPHKMPA